MALPHDIDIPQSNILLKRQVDARLPNYGVVLPDAAKTPDGVLFTVTSSGILYQLQSGAWVALT